MLVCVRKEGALEEVKVPSALSDCVVWIIARRLALCIQLCADLTLSLSPARHAPAHASLRKSMSPTTALAGLQTCARYSPNLTDPFAGTFTSCTA